MSKRHGFRFRIADQDYRLSFVPESDMSQTNVKYGTIRNVRRRPEKFVSRDDIQVMKRYCSIVLQVSKVRHLVVHFDFRSLSIDREPMVHWS